MDEFNFSMDSRDAIIHKARLAAIIPAVDPVIEIADAPLVAITH